ncbi:MAG: fasciclin domain-containing protein [Thermostichales cyanobacterium SZTDM-1c_bins_54]
MRFRALWLTGLAVLASLSVACGNTTSAPFTARRPTIVELSQLTTSLSTLNQAVTAAELGTVLAGEGPFTVFAPVNSAFAALPPETLEELLLPANREQLVNLLTYHVVEGAILSSQLEDGQELTTVQGGVLTITIEDEVIQVNGIPLLQADILADNGVVHLIGEVLMPPAMPAE